MRLLQLTTQNIVVVVADEQTEWSHHLTADKKREQEDVKKLEIKCLNHPMRLSQSSPRQML